MEKQTYGVETILKRVQPDDYIKFNYELRDCQEDFGVNVTLNEKFVSPILSVVKEYSNESLKDAHVILIEAVGASGKTELTKFLSYKLHCPVLDLGRTKVVAGNSLTGLLNKRMKRGEALGYMDSISEGRSTILIDALDEGYMKTNNQGYLDFIDDVLSLEPKNACPIIMLGRYNAVELAAIYLDEKGIPFMTLQIEPFTLPKAKEFIDNSVKNLASLRFEAVYKETRDYLLETIGGFFKDQGSIKNNASERFLGYAPVLQSISAFFDEYTNYHMVLDQLREKKTRSVSLIVDVIERILDRDRYEKVIPGLLQDLIKDRDSNFKSQVESIVYSREEQCARILYKVLNYPFPDIEIEDPSFITIYNERISTWIDEHPFLGKNEIGNIVFESYILALLVKNKKYRNAVYEYLRKKGTSYMFAYIYKELHGYDNVESIILPYIYSSFAELNNKQSYYVMNLDFVTEDSNMNKCVFDFLGSDDSMEDYSGTVYYNKTDFIDFGDQLGYLNISVPMDYHLVSRKVHVSSPLYIKCNRLVVNSEELILYKGGLNKGIMFECKEFAVEQMYDQYVKVSGSNNVSGQISLVCPDRVDYPFFEFWTSEDGQLKTLSQDNMRKYKKLRAIILEFRSHSKRELAKHHEKIDFVLGGTELGKNVIAALIYSKIMFKDGHLYKIDSDVMDEVLGLSYDEIRNFVITPAIISFLNTIE